MKAALKMYFEIASLFIILSLVIGFHYAWRGFRHVPQDASRHVPVADAERGRLLIREYGCGACHIVPGAPNATGRVGPRLDELRENVYIAGVVPNTPQDLIVWIQDPQEVAPRTAMPDLDVGLQDARDIAAYLYSLD